MVVLIFYKGRWNGASKGAYNSMQESGGGRWEGKGEEEGGAGGTREVPRENPQRHKTRWYAPIVIM